MKYFPPNLWLGFNSRNEKSRNAADRTWKKNFGEYKKSLKKVLPLLSPNARWFFRDPLLLHDGTLSRMEIGDQIDRIGRARNDSWDERNARVRLFVDASIGEFVCELDYKLIRNVRMNFPGAISLFPAGQYPNFGDWGYDEISITKEGLFLHEILFSSGASISIEFQKFSARKKLLK